MSFSCLTVCLHVCHLVVSLSVCMSVIWLSRCLSACLSFGCLAVCLHVCHLVVSLSDCLLHDTACLHVCHLVCLWSICLSFTHWSVCLLTSYHLLAITCLPCTLFVCLPVPDIPTIASLEPGQPGSVTYGKG